MQADQFGLPGKTVQAIQNVFSQYSGIQKAILYGSRAMGNNRPASDIDLTLLAPGWTLTELFRLETELDDLLLPYTIDLSLLHRIDNAELLAHIDRVGVTFYESTSTELH